MTRASKKNHFSAAVWVRKTLRMLGVVLLCAVGTARGDEETFVHGLSLLHDLKYAATFEHFDYVNPDAPKGGLIIASEDQDIRNFGGDWSNEIDAAPGSERAYDTLIIRAADELAGYYGLLAEGMQLSKDKRVLTFRLRPEARFHDGEPLTTRDVKFSFDQAMGTVDGQLFLDWIQSVEIVNEREIRLKLEDELTNANLLILSYAPRVLPYHYWVGKADPSETTLVPPLSSGPYRVAGFDKGHVRYERVKDYWGKDLPVNRGRFNFDEIRYDVYRDANVTREAVNKGLIDYFFENDLRHWFSAYDTPAAGRGWVIQDQLYVRDNAGPSTVIVFNTRRPRFADVRVREALVLAYDYEWQNRVLWYDQQTRAASYFARSDFASRGLPNAAERKLLMPFRGRIPERVFTQAYSLPVSKGSGFNEAALVHARQLLAEAGWRVDDGILVNAQGRPFEMEFLSPTRDQIRILLPYTNSLKRLGIAARVRLVEAAQMANLYREFKYDAFIQGHGTSQPPIMMLPFFFHSHAADKPLTSNRAGIADPVVDALIERAQAATRLEDIVTICRALDRVLLFGFYHIPLNTVDAPRLVYWDKFGRPERERQARHAQATAFVNLWWYDREKAARIVVRN